ncbi:hypothetical protein [Pontibacter kalidii]|uniref:hypothetical protein n=1 Tax=Pontibacter kalidii TaxID=2592049 RepID=UPI002254913D|nr:hypothetical protein [Pontibacter kalidii]
MIAFRIADEELDLNASTSVQVEYFSSLFETDRIPGMLTYPVTLPWSKKNKRMLGFPGSLSMRRYRKEPFDCQLYLNNLWRVGKLYIMGTSDSGISVSFQSDIGDLGEAFKNDSLRELDLGSGLEFVRFTVRNDKFADNTQVPYPYLVHILRQVMKQYGYTCSGAWLDDASIRSLVIYNVQPPDPGQVIYAHHMPDMKVNDFLKAIRAAFALGFVFNTTTKNMEIVRLRDVIRNTDFADWRSRQIRVKEWKPNETDGFRLELKPDSNDDLNKELSVEAYTFQVGKGKETIPIGLGTLKMAADGVPVASQEANYEGKFGLNLLYYGGQQAQPLVPATLYAQYHREWLEFLSETETVEADVSLSITDLRTLRQDRKVLVQDELASVKALWRKISVTVSLDKGIQTAKASFFKVRV